MARQDEIHSTEKLLELIRKNDEGDSPGAKDDVPATAIPKPSMLNRAIAFRKKIIIGIDIGHSYIKVAKVNHISDKNCELLDYHDIALNKQVALKDIGFRKCLKETLDLVCADTPKFAIWSAIPSANVIIQYIRIPKLPRKQVPNAVFWTFTKKVAFNIQEELLDYEILEDITEGGVKKTEVMACKAPQEEVIALKTTFQEIGYPLDGITIIPFAIQNLFRTQIIAPEEKNVCSLFIGRDWSRIAIFNKGNLILARGIKAGMHSMIEAINISIQREPRWLEKSINADASENTPYDHTTAIDPAAQKMFFDLIGHVNTPGDRHKDVAALDPPQTFQMLMPAMERLIRQVERTFAHYAIHFNRKGIRRIYLSGQVSANPMFAEYIGRQLSMPVAVMDPFPVGSVFTNPIIIPEHVWQRESFMPSIGLALSNNSITPNFIFTHQDKERVEDIRRTNMRVLTACIICLLILISLFSWQNKKLEQKRAHVEALNAKTMAYNLPADKQLVLVLYARTQKKRQTLQSILERYAPAAVVNELAQKTPDNVRLITLDALFTPPNDESKTGKVDVLAIEGLIFGDESSFESTLTSYLLILKNSPIFRKPNIQYKRMEYFDKQTVLRFSAHLEII